MSTATKLGWTSKVSEQKGFLLGARGIQEHTSTFFHCTVIERVYQYSAGASSHPKHYIYQKNAAVVMEFAVGQDSPCRFIQRLVFDKATHSAA
ncbi:hypothetical protein OUZ56_012236 [Daphnia magna]|uniref:Uncharacterized protein n=1 Tax=Daphnia magna TaxID=35525 RepID=A0ABQ9Z2F7_9CRUS|nr:hypothetical protein OUZ56_012236 [Daphnia magna]